MRWRSCSKATSSAPCSSRPRGTRIFIGSTKRLLTSTSKCRCGPVERPVEPTIADHLALRDARRPPSRPLRVAAHVVVGGLVAVGVAQRDRAAVAGARADLLHHAVAGRHDRRARRRRPVDAGMHAVAAHDRVPAHAEAGGEAALRDRLAHQEFLRALARLVVIVDRAVVRSRGSGRSGA